MVSCVQCQQPVPEGNKGYLTKYCSKRCYSAVLHITLHGGVKRCAQCGCEFKPGRYQRLCSDACKAEAFRENRRKHSRISRAARRVIHKASPIDPIAVFERDGWVCYLCGVQTPAIYRGHNFPNSPELEHRFSLSNGGMHTMCNVACACRSCNQLKGSMNENTFRKLLNSLNDNGSHILSTR